MYFNELKLAAYKAKYFNYSVENNIATISLNYPERKNPLSLDSYAELRDLFRETVYAKDIEAIVFASSGGDLCSGCGSRKYRPVGFAH
jgi:enoyl-CoA hydratase/carnithine racemase